MSLGSRATGGVVNIRVTTGGASYTAPPSVAVSGGGGTGATAYCQMNGGAVESVVIVSGGTGFTASPAVSFSGGGGTGAQAVATVCTSARPMSFFKGRYSTVYGVDGMGRGVRWDGGTAVGKIGLLPPALPPAVTSSTTAGGKGIQSVAISYGGAGYYAPPSVSFVGGTPSRAAAAKAAVQGGQVVGIRVTDAGAGYQTVPSVAMTGGYGSGCALSASLLGSIDSAFIIAQGTGYTAATPPTVTFSTTQGLTGAVVDVRVDDFGRIADVLVLSAGTGATTSGVIATVTGGGGTGAQLQLGMQYSVASVSVVSGGTGYWSPPAVVFTPDPADPFAVPAAATAAVTGSGAVQSVTVLNGGAYSLPPSVGVQPPQAIAVANMGSPLAGEYRCCIRYVDDTPRTQNGPLASSISQLATVDAGSGATRLTWSFSHGPLDERVAAMELWRTTGGQSVILFRVATIARTDAGFSGTYVDSFSDAELSDPEREGYALMPVTLPSGQVNARRFGVPPAEFAVGCMFQDRAWYAVDATGRRPNSLMYSEVDEPESVPEINELVVQENTGEPDTIEALIPLGATLLVAQSAHIYKLTYVAQPVIDASIMLVSTRGVLHNRCWATMNGVVFLVDSQGMYAFDGQNEEALSIAIDNYWRDGRIDFSKAQTFHVAADSQTKTVRFFYCGAADAEPTRALVYCVATKAWWEERYASPVTASCRAMVSNRLQPLYAAGSAFCRLAGASDSGAAVPYEYRSGPMQLADEGGSRAVGLLFTPTDSACTLKLALHYNNSSQPRVNAIASDRGGAFVTALGSTSAELNLSKVRSALGEASGHATAHYSGRVDDRSVGADRHLAIAVSGEQVTDRVTLHGISVSGVT